MLRLVVKLKPDHAFSLCRMLHEPSDHALRIIQIYRMRDIHDLARAVDAAASFCYGKYIRVGLHHPCRNRIGRRPHDHMDPRLLHGIQYSVHMGKIKYSLLGFAGAPRRLRDPHRIDPRLFHHPDIFL